MDKEFLETQLESCRQEHKNLDDELVSLLSSGAMDDLYIHRLKKKKLIIKDQIRIIESRLMTDIIA